MHDASRRATRGVLISWGGSLITLLTAYVLTPILINTLGDTTYGLWTLLVALVGFLGLIDLGISKAVAKYLAQYDAGAKEQSIRTLTSTAASMYLRLTIVALAASAMVAWMAPIVFDIGEYSPSIIRLVILVAGLTVAVDLLGATFRAAIVGRKRFEVINLLDTGAHVLQAFLVVLVVCWGGGLLWMAVIMLAVNVSVQALAYTFATRKLAVPPYSRHDVDPEFRTLLLGFGARTFVAQGAEKLNSQSGSVITGAVMGPAAAAYYAVAESLALHCTALATAICQVIMPMSSQ